MRRTLCCSLFLLLLLASAPAAFAADVPISNAGAENPTTAGNEATGWGQNFWGTNTTSFTRPAGGANGGTYSLRIDVSGYSAGDAKWLHTPVAVTGGKFYRFTDWYKSDTDTAVSMFWQTQAEASGVCGTEECGTWSNLETGIAPSATWKRFEASIDMPETAAQATFVHLIAHDGYLQTDDYAVERLDSPSGFKRPLVTLTFDDSTPNLYDYVLPELDKLGYRSTQYVVTGATGVRDDNGVLYQWSAEQIADVHKRGHEIGSHTEYHPNLSLSGPTAVCEAKDAEGLPTYTANPGTCATGETAKTVPASWLDPFGGSSLWLRPATVGRKDTAWFQALADTTLSQELGDSKGKLESTIGYGVPTIAYPFGGYDSNVIETEKALGYKAGRSVDEGYNSKVGLDPFKIKVQNMQQAVCTDTATGTVAKADRSAGEDSPTCAAGQTMSADVTTAQFKQWVQKAKDNNYWLVLVYHPVDDLGVNPYGTSTKRFAEQMQAIKDAGIKVKTMRDALNEVMPQVGSWTKLPTLSPDDEIPGDTPAPGPIPGPNPNPPRDHVTVPSPVGSLPDRKAPKVVVSSPRAGKYKVGQTLKIKLSVSDNSGSMSWKATLRRSGGKAKTVKQGGKVRLTRTGSYALRVVAKDRAGNTTTKTVNFRVVRR